MNLDFWCLNCHNELRNVSKPDFGAIVSCPVCGCVMSSRTASSQPIVYDKKQKIYKVNERKC